jgi:hypothetical protein
MSVVSKKHSSISTLRLPMVPHPEAFTILFTFNRIKSTIAPIKQLNIIEWACLCGSCLEEAQFYFYRAPACSGLPPGGLAISFAIDCMNCRIARNYSAEYIVSFPECSCRYDCCDVNAQVLYF